MRKDAIIDELHEIRRDHARKFEYDLHKIFADLKDQERKSGRIFLALPVQRNRERSRKCNANSLVNRNDNL